MHFECSNLITAWAGARFTNTANFSYN